MISLHVTWQLYMLAYLKIQRIKETHCVYCHVHGSRDPMEHRSLPFHLIIQHTPTDNYVNIGIFLVFTASTLRLLSMLCDTCLVRTSNIVTRTRQVDPYLPYIWISYSQCYVTCMILAKMSINNCDPKIKMYGIPIVKAIV